MPKDLAFLDQELYLPRGWAEAGVAEVVAFHTKPQLAQLMLSRALEAGVAARWVTGDEIYGSDRRLPIWLEEREIPHVLAVKGNEPLWTATDRGPAQVAAAGLAEQITALGWQRLSAGEGAQAV